MSSWQIYGLGFLAQIFFSARLISQWILSERHHKIMTPSLFWKLSLIASVLLFFYGYFREDFSIMLGQTLTYFIYIRNLQLQGEWQKIHRSFQWSIYLFPLAIIIYSFNNNSYDLDRLFFNEAIPIWLLILGTGAQILFNLRFVYQWIYSERTKISSLPLGFWTLSLLGASLILLYSVIRKDPVLFLGHCAGSVIYIRNIILSKKLWVP